MSQGQIYNTDDVAGDLIGKTIETNFATGAIVTDRVVAIHVEVNESVTGRTGTVRRLVLFEHVRPIRSPFDPRTVEPFADWFELQPNTSLHVFAEPGEA